MTLAATVNSARRQHRHIVSYDRPSDGQHVQMANEENLASGSLDASWGQFRCSDRDLSGLPRSSKTEGEPGSLGEAQV